MPRRTGVLWALWTYLGALGAPRIGLWCCFIWWAFTVRRHFVPSPQLWFTALALAAVVGTALHLSATLAGKPAARLEKHQIVRLYLVPFCVSSFSALVKDRGFFLFFHPTPDANAEATGLCMVFVAFALFARLTTRGRVT